MTFSIPQEIFDKYFEVCDYLLEDNNFSRVCKIYYPPIKEACVNCTTNFGGGASSNVYQHGGPAPFSNTTCGYCGGNGYREKEVTDTLRLRIYWNKKDWIKTNSTSGSQKFALGEDSIVIGGSIAQIIGSVDDIVKISRMREMQVISEQKELNHRYILAAEPFFHGFGKHRYFVAFIKRC